MGIKEYLKMMVEKNASDMFYRCGNYVHMRIDGKVVAVGNKAVTLEEANNAVSDLTPTSLKGSCKKTGTLISESLSRR